MLVKTKAIVISSLKFQDKNLIVKCFTQSDGLKSYFVRGAFSSGKSTQKAAYFQPLTLLEIEASHKNKGTLEHFREVKISAAFHSIHSDVVKSAMVLFLSEMLHHAIKEEEKNEPLFAFLETALHWLDHHDELANFHLILLLETAKFLGFYPDLSDNHKPFFEMTEGVFADVQAPSSLSDVDSNLLKKLTTLRFDNAAKAFHVSERQRLLKILVDYYSHHLDGFQKPKSLEVLAEVFS